MQRIITTEAQLFHKKEKNKNKISVNFRNNETVFQQQKLIIKDRCKYIN